MAADRETLVTLLTDAVARRADSPAIFLPNGEGVYRSLTWREIASNVRRLALLLRRLGVQPGDRVVQVSENRYEWILFDLAVMMARGVHVAVHSVLSGPQIARQLRRLLDPDTNASRAPAIANLPGNLRTDKTECTATCNPAGYHHGQIEQNPFIPAHLHDLIAGSAFSPAIGSCRPASIGMNGFCSIWP